MDVVQAFSAINAGVLAVARSVNVLKPVENAEVTDYLRLQEIHVPISKQSKRVSDVVSCHNLSQYKNKYHSLTLVEDIDTAFKALLKAQQEEIACI